MLPCKYLHHLMPPVLSTTNWTASQAPVTDALQFGTLFREKGTLGLYGPKSYLLPSCTSQEEQTCRGTKKWEWSGATCCLLPLVMDHRWLIFPSSTKL